ncbi:MAG: LuxR C-terminal-related transcriptional regulator [Egibacteraceae bacterium]
MDKHPVMRLGIVALLRPEDDIQAIDAAESIDEAVRFAADEHPDVVVLDFILKGQQSGAGLCRQLKSASSPPGVVIYTDSDAAEELFLCQLSGADSYVHKDEEPGRLLEAIRATHAGKRVWFMGGEETSTLNQPAVCENASLTPRERQILGLMLKRYTNSDIAGELGISLQTVKNHASNVLRKIGVSRRTDLPWEQPPSFSIPPVRRLGTGIA